MKICKECDNFFKPTHHNQKFCSDRCRGRDKKQRNNTQWKIVRDKRKKEVLSVERTCTECGVMYEPRATNSKTCSEECYLTRRRKLARRNRLAIKNNEREAHRQPERGDDPRVTKLLEKLGKPRSQIDMICERGVSVHRRHFEETIEPKEKLWQ